MSKASELAQRLRGCVTDSGGIDCRDPALLCEAADMLDRLAQYGENVRQVTVQLSKRIEELDPNAPRAETR